MVKRNTKIIRILNLGILALFFVGGFGGVSGGGIVAGAEAVAVVVAFVCGGGDEGGFGDSVNASICSAIDIGSSVVGVSGNIVSCSIYPIHTY